MWPGFKKARPHLYLLDYNLTVSVKRSTEIAKSNPVSLIFYGALFVTLYFDSKAQDPFNSPKFWALMLLSAVLTGYIFSAKINFAGTDSLTFRLIWMICLSYLVVMLVSVFFSYDKQTAILGESFRRNGLLTYSGFIIVFIAAIMFVRFSNINQGLKILSAAGLITGLYALVQDSGNDWIKWSAQNQVISTFGNTNFSGVGMAIFAIITFGQVIIYQQEKLKAFSYSVIFSILVYSVLKTNARQALIILIFALILFSSLFLYRVNKRAWLLTTCLFVMFVILSILAIFRLGPLQDLLYKGSISVRGYYWRAALEMFTAHPFFGVGIDQYGSFFKQFREPGYPLAYGWNITSSNAHNVFLQSFATGGIFVGILYTALQLLIFYKAIGLIRLSTGAQQVIAVLLFSAWIAYQAQSLVSIEFIGVSIWGWIIGGSLIGLSFKNEPIISRKSKQSVNFNWKMITVSTSLSIAAIVLIIPLRQAERDTSRQGVLVDVANQQQFEIFNSSSANLLKNNFAPNDYVNSTAVNLLRIGNAEEALRILQKLNQSDYRNLDTLALLVDIYEKTNRFEQAIVYRLQIAEFDPWNAQNYLGLAQLYKQIGSFEQMNAMVEKIQSFASADPIAEVALREFPPTLG
jgi:O-antigen ligase